MPTSLVQLSDCRLNVVDEGTGPVVLLVHGFPLNHAMWREQVPVLSQTFRVIAPDLRGFGESAGAEDVLSMSQLADDMANLLDALGIAGPIVFCGLSMGGYVAWEFWRRHPARLAKLVLCDTRAVADTPEGAKGRLELADKVLAQGSVVVADAMLPKLLSPESLVRHHDVVEPLQQMILTTAPTTIAAALRGLAQRDDFSGRLGEIDVPALVICGAHDAIAPPAEMRGIAAALPKGRYIEIPDAGHMSPLEAPEKVNAALLEFLRH